MKVGIDRAFWYLFKFCLFLIYARVCDSLNEFPCLLSILFTPCVLCLLWLHETVRKNGTDAKIITFLALYTALIHQAMHDMIKTQHVYFICADVPPAHFLLVQPFRCIYCCWVLYVTACHFMLCLPGVDNDLSTRWCPLFAFTCPQPPICVFLACSRVSSVYFLSEWLSITWCPNDPTLICWVLSPTCIYSLPPIGIGVFFCCLFSSQLSHPPFALVALGFSCFSFSWHCFTCIGYVLPNVTIDRLLLYVSPWYHVYKALSCGLVGVHPMKEDT